MMWEPQSGSQSQWGSQGCLRLAGGHGRSLCPTTQAKVKARGLQPWTAGLRLQALCLGLKLAPSLPSLASAVGLRGLGRLGLPDVGNEDSPFPYPVINTEERLSQLIDILIHQNFAYP